MSSSLSMSGDHTSSVLRSLWHRVRAHRPTYHFHVLGGLVDVRCTCGQRWMERI